MIATEDLKLVLELASLGLPPHLLAIEPSSDPDFEFVLRIKEHALPNGEPYSAALYLSDKDLPRSVLITEIRGLAGAYNDSYNSALERSRLESLTPTLSDQGDAL